MSADDSLVVSLVVGAVLFVALVAGVLLASTYDPPPYVPVPPDYTECWVMGPGGLFDGCFDG